MTGPSARAIATAPSWSIWSGDRIVDLLEDRKAETLAPWLSQYPGVEVISRDRAPAYAEAARKGAPQAVQVADRWHLIQNLVEALERCLLRFRPALKVAAGMGDSHPRAAAQLERDRPGPLAATGGSRQSAEARQQGGAVRADADAPGRRVHRPRYRPARWRHVGARSTAISPSEALPNGSGPIAPGTACWRRTSPTCSSAGRRAAAIARGCSARSGCWAISTAPEPSPSSSSVSSEQPSASAAASSRPTVTRVPSARHVACLLVWRKDQLPEEERDYLERLCDHEPTIALAYELAQEFADDGS